MLRKITRSLLVRTLWTLLGRKNLVRLGRLLSNEGRLDVLNDPTNNGETLIQSCVWKYHTLHATPSLCVLDVGANVGDWSHSFFQQAPASSPTAAIHAFEPFPATHQTLQQNLQQWQLSAQVKTHNIALSSQPGEHTFYALGDNIGINSLHPFDESISPTTGHEISVTTDTLDRVCQECHIEHIHFMKIDTEGHDLEVIQGSEQMLQRSAIDIIQFEYNTRWIIAHHFLRDAFQYLQPFGFHLGKVTPHGVEWYDTWHYELETFREANFLAIKPELKSAFPQISWWNQSA